MNKINEIAHILAITKDEKIIERFIISLLTPKEINDISLRWALVKLLNDGMTQRKISKKLGISLCKITRGSRELKKRRSAFKYMIEAFDKSIKKKKA